MDEELQGILAAYNAPQKKKAITPEELAMGFSRSYLAGPTFNFADELEAGIAGGLKSLPLVGNDKSFGENYNEEVTQIRDEQRQFKEAVPYVGTGLEIASGIVLNPLEKASKVVQGLKGLQTAGRAMKWAPTQGLVAGAGLGEGLEGKVTSAGYGLALGSGLSALSSVAGNVLQKTGLNATKFKASAFRLGHADLQRQVKKLGAEGIAEMGDDLPIINAMNKYEQEGVIRAGADVLDNLKNVIGTRSQVGDKLGTVLREADKIIPPARNFQTKNVEAYVNQISGTAQDDALNAAANEYVALTSQMKSGSLADLQKAKVGLNYKFGENPYKEDIVTALRQDLKEEIENRVNEAAKNGALPAQLEGAVKSLNKEWGDLADLGDTFARGVTKKYGGNAVEDLITNMGSTRGVGTMTQATAASGNPLPMMFGGVVAAARGPEGLSALGDASREFSTPLQAVGKALPEIGTARNITQANQGYIAEQGREEPQAQGAIPVQISPDEINELSEILRQYNAPAPIPRDAKEIKANPQASQQLSALFGMPPIETMPDQIAEQMVAQVSQVAPPGVFQRPQGGYLSAANGRLNSPMDQAAHMQMAIEQPAAERARVISALWDGGKYEPLPLQNAGSPVVTQPQQVDPFARLARLGTETPSSNYSNLSDTDNMLNEMRQAQDRHALA